MRLVSLLQFPTLCTSQHLIEDLGKFPSSHNNLQDNSNYSMTPCKFQVKRITSHQQALSMRTTHIIYAHIDRERGN
ncbi:unnamed protein product [Allacma fusca]|uniref:Uncharacterized protein n=1 Tax=Allacma fusca TaxID=39272 RepID=A0A8J2K1E1_9HEXA|nr:unnamed protein product [Allacma fusca]